MSKNPPTLLKDSMPDYDSEEYQLGYKLASINRNNGNVLLGRLLTIVDSAFTDSRQAKATKDLIRREVWNIIDETQRGIYATVTGGEYAGPAVSMSDDGTMN